VEFFCGKTACPLRDAGKKCKIGTDLTAGPLRRLVGWPVWKASMANLAWKKGKYYGTQ